MLTADFTIIPDAANPLNVGFLIGVELICGETFQQRNDDDTHKCDDGGEFRIVNSTAVAGTAGNHGNSRQDIKSSTYR